MKYLRLALIFIKTAYYGYRLSGQNDLARIQIKHSWAKMVLKSLGYSLQIQGQAPQNKPLVLVGNHISFLDIPVVMAAFPDVVFIAKDDLKKWPIVGAAATSAGTIFVDRQRGATQKSVRQQILDSMLSSKKNIVVFPSGTTTLFEEKPWKKGIFTLAKQSQTSIQLFQLSYQPLRESAYIDEDHLLTQILSLLKIKHKTVTLRWLNQYDQIDQPELLSEQLRLKVAKK